MSDLNNNLVTINVDGQPVKVKAGTNVIEALSKVGKEVPHYCYHPKLSVAGNCRMCLVEAGMPVRDRETGQPVLDENGNPQVRWAPNPAIGCATNASEGLHIRTESEVVKKSRNGVTEFLLANHPLDCPICDQAGECTLQEYSADHGRGYSRFEENKNAKPKHKKIGPRIMLDNERCILCSRCVRFCDEIIEDNVLGITQRGSYSTIDCFPGKEFDSNYSLNTVDICPVGALTSTDFRFQMRVWFLKQTKSICTESSVGTNTIVWSREGKIYRITPRQNDAVNDVWMTDSGRELYKPVEAENRLKEYRLNGAQVSLPETLEQAKLLLKDGKVAIVASGRLALEEQYLFKKISDQVDAKCWFATHNQEGDNLLLSNDRTPNLRGGLVTGLIKDIPSDNLADLVKQVESGEVDTLVVYGEDLSVLGFSDELLRKVKIISFATHNNLTFKLSKVQFPILTVFEKKGTFINQQFRLQKFDQAIPGPSGVLADVHILSHLLNSLRDVQHESFDFSKLWNEMSESIPLLNGIHFNTLSDEGICLDKSAFSSMKFVEGKTLHYDPNANKEAVEC